MKQKILHVLCEGYTEQGFVNEVLKPFLINNGFYNSVKPILLTTNKKKNAEGGLISYIQAKNNLNTMMLSNRDDSHSLNFFTTMFDLYSLPNDFPGYSKANSVADKYLRIQNLEQSYAETVNSNNFIPYIQLHEFESLLFCGIEYLIESYPNSRTQCDKLKSVLIKHNNNPELINDGSDTAPSKRIITAVESDRQYKYNKPKTGKNITKIIGIEALCSKCPHFNDWIQRLKNISMSCTD